MNIEIQTEHVAMQPEWHRMIDQWLERCARSHPEIMDIDVRLRHGEPGRHPGEEVDVVATADGRSLRGRGRRCRRRRGGRRRRERGGDGHVADEGRAVATDGQGNVIVGRSEHRRRQRGRRRFHRRRGPDRHLLQHRRLRRRPGSQRRRRRHVPAAAGAVSGRHAATLPGRRRRGLLGPRRSSPCATARSRSRLRCSRCSSCRGCSGACSRGRRRWS